MRIFAINNNSYFNKQKQNKSFKAHPDFDRLAKLYQIKASSYFRRGALFGSPSDEFESVAQTLLEYFAKDMDSKKTMLIAGIADSQEPFSYLAVLKNYFPHKLLKEILDLYIVDLQSQPSSQKIKKDSFFDCYYKPDYATNSFVKDDGSKYGGFKYQKWRVKSEITNYLTKVYRNAKKSMWDSRIQEAINKYPNEKFDIVSINNTLIYIEDKSLIEKTLQQVIRILKPNGIFIQTFLHP